MGNSTIWIIIIGIIIGGYFSGKIKHALRECLVI